MNRKKFIKTCGYGCLGMMAGTSVLSSCVGTRYIQSDLEGGFMLVPLDTFVKVQKGISTYRPYVVAHHDSLQYPIAIFRLSDREYHALWMQCTHQGTELQVFGDRLQCPAHGSEFTNMGAVQNGPADSPLRAFPVTMESHQLKINLQ